MLFLSLREIQKTKDAFEMTLSSSKAQQGYSELGKLRVLQHYDLLLANYISHEDRTDVKLLALMEFKKNISEIQHEQVWWVLHDLYYRSSSDKVASIVCEIITSSNYNISKMVSFFTFDF